MKRSILILCLILTLGLCFTENDTEIFDVFTKGTAGSSIAFGSSLFSFQLNPANTVVFEKGSFSVFIPAFTFNQEAGTLYKFYKDNKDRFEEDDFDFKEDMDWDDIDHILSQDPFFAFQMPLNFFMVTKPDKLGIRTLFGISSYVRLNTDIKKGVIPPISSTISAELIGDLYIPFSISFPIKISKYKLNLGTTLKYIHRQKVFIDKELTPSLYNYVPVRYIGNGFGVDVGATFEFNEQINFGASLLNVGGTRFTWTAVKFDEDDTRPVTIDTSPTYIKPNLNIGFTYFPKIKGLPHFIDNNFVSVSFNDLIRPQDYLLNHLKIGLGSRIVRVLNLYGGLNGGYPVFGVNLDIWVFQASYSYHSLELGKYPGQIRDGRHLFYLSFGSHHRATPREERWTEKKKEPKKSVKVVETKPEVKEPEISQEIIDAQKEAERKREEELKKQEELKKIQEQAKKELEQIKTEENDVGKPEPVKEKPVLEEEQKEEIIEVKVPEKKVEIEEKVHIDPIGYFKNIPHERTSNGVKLMFNINYAPGRTDIPEDQKGSIYPIVDALKKIKARVMVNSYTDSTGSQQGNMNLSQQRADKVREYFILNGIASDKVISTGFGSQNPIADNSTPEGRTKNRRVEILIFFEE